ncbi:ubiquitin carboxyl-terminal hydrolase 25-like [Mercenaria mercenaria]|uniref:ubiquitin carboxyl-terminal hydrolase 25-like n=1 Tax=Mercenaria mercenaria TaxID=6596 RepID=UPI00234F6471|nr:ubiquitin carboxyl-terminal hydrolase 25-like [Mercenaria mercenaria]
MTVEQPALQRFGQTKASDDHTYATVKEITGITDRKRICQAIEACRNKDGKYEVTEVVNMLVSDTAIKAENSSEKKMAITYLKDKDSVDAVAGPQQNLNKNSKGGVIDLTNVSDTNETEDIQKAIAASLADSGGPYQQETAPGILGGQVSREEQDISRVLEQSLIESKAGTKRKRGDLWFVDPLNPHERKRNEDWPIGLKNVGNTCWFSAVIQSLFHLRRFRHLVLTYQPNKEASQSVTGNIEVRRNLRFMQELRHLFALMVGSKRKYVDPSKAVDILKEAFSSTVVSNTSVTDSQQDVSEFQHKLLDWLEDAFKTASRPSTPAEGSENSSSSEKTCNNPMVDLFYGQYRADGVNEGKGFSNEETFGQFPLQVNGFRDIHESLEAATAHREIETVNTETTQKSGQELWFTRLPPVLTFELSRFQFNQQIGRPEKIHNKIEFPHVIYMDRYLDCNRNETRHRRERAKKLKEELVLLQAKLDKFINYGSGVKRFPLQDVLIYALEFAKSRSEVQRKSVTLSQDVDMECPSPNTSMMVDSPIKSPADVVMATVTSPSPLQSPESSNKSPSTASTSPTLPQPIPDISMTPASHRTSTSSTPPDIAMGCESRASPTTTKSEEVLRSPQPRHVSDAELLVLQNCLHRWRTEVESDVRELQENISRLEDSINRMYSDEAMTKNAYHLHAVLVHEGQAASGHYWAYIYDTASEQWLKFNDITVSEASWEELEKESVGGYHNASAYCLMYIDKSRITDEAVSGKPGTSMASDLENLPDDLKELVASDNKVFAEEIEKWDRELARKAAGGGDADVTVIAEQKPALLTGSSSSTVSTQTTQQSVRTSYASVHAYLSLKESVAALRKVLETDAYDKKGPTDAMHFGVELEHKRLKNVVGNIEAEFPIHDPRLQHIVTYMMYCDCSNELILIMLLEQFAEIMWEENEKIKKMKIAAIEWRKKLLSESEKIEKLYLFWHETYQIYRKTVALFVKGVLTYFDEKYILALSYLIHAHRLSEEMKKRHKNACLPEPKISAFFLRQTLLHINDTITQQFEDLTDVTGLLDSMKTHVLPCLQTVVNSGSQEDITAVEEIREKWCSFLGQEMEAQKIEQLQDFLSKLFEPPLDLHIPKMPSLKHESMQNLYAQFAKVMENAQEYGYIERALKNS